MGEDHGIRTKHVANPNNGPGQKNKYVFKMDGKKDNKGVDFGIWNKISPSKLSCPLDIHSGRSARVLNLLQRNKMIGRL